MTKKTLLIAIDGPSSSGKGTIAKKIAQHFNLPCLNTGGLYRALAFLAKEKNLNIENDLTEILPLIKKIELDNLENPKFHNEKIGELASIIAKNSQIRQNLFNLQKDFATKNLNRAIIEGRDIGTVICPNADYKFFITASPEKRAERRSKQLSDQKDVTYNQIFKQLKLRDEQDKNRKNSPLIKADDAIEIDTSNLTIEQTFNSIISYIK